MTQGPGDKEPAAGNHWGGEDDAGDFQTGQSTPTNQGGTPPSDSTDGDDPTPSGSRLRLVAACLGLAIAAMVLGFVVLLLAFVFVIDPLGIDLSGTAGLVVSLITLQGIAFPGTAWLYFRWKGRSLREFVPVSVPSRREVGIAVGSWIGLLVLVIVASNLIIGATGTEPAENSASQTVAQNPEFVPYLLPLVFLLNAPGEELLFRGVIQGLLRERFSAPGAIVLATLMFAPIHITALVGSPQAAAVTIALVSIPSLVFGAVYEYTDNLVVPTLVHGFYNSTLFLIIYAVA